MRFEIRHEELLLHPPYRDAGAQGPANSRTLRRMSSSILPSLERAKKAQRAVATYFLANGIVMGAWVPHVPDRARELHLDAGTLGWALLASGLGAVMAMPIAGRMTARLGSRAVCRVAGVAFPIMLSAVVLAPTALLMAMALLWQHCCRNQRFHSQPLEAPRKFTLADNSEVAL